jgi:hypothetical protein
MSNVVPFPTRNGDPRSHQPLKEARAAHGEAIELLAESIEGYNMAALPNLSARVRHHMLALQALLERGPQ